MSVTELQIERRQIDLVVAYTHVKGENVDVPPEESWCVFIHHVEVNGYWFWPEVAKLTFDGFAELRLCAVDYEPAEYRDKHLQEIADLKATLTADDWLDGTTDEMLCLPVSKMQWVQHQYGN